MATEDQACASESTPPPLSDAADMLPFDFADHRRKAVDAYREVRDIYVECAQAVRSVLKSVLDMEAVKVQVIEARGKSVKSFGDKTEEVSEIDANLPLYPNPLRDITDLAGVRVIVYLLDRLTQVDALVYRQFDVLKKNVHGGLLGDDGYESTHYLVQFKAPRAELPEYERFRNLTIEVQVRTVLQHGWAEIEHGIVYKPDRSPSDAVRKQLREIAGMLRIVDREFQRAETESKGEDSGER